MLAVASADNCWSALGPLIGVLRQLQLIFNPSWPKVCSFSVSPARESTRPGHINDQILQDTVLHCGCLQAYFSAENMQPMKLLTTAFGFGIKFQCNFHPSWVQEKRSLGFVSKLPILPESIQTDVPLVSPWRSFRLNVITAFRFISVAAWAVPKMDDFFRFEVPFFDTAISKDFVPGGASMVWEY